MKTISRRLEDLFEEELRSDLRNVLITKDTGGVINMFGKYAIKPVFGIYRVSGTGKKVDFVEQKNAIAYTILVNEGKHNLANRVHVLDLNLSSINFNIANHRRILKTKAEDKLVYQIKIQEDLIKKRLILSEIQSHINSSMQLQGRRFTESS